MKCSQSESAVKSCSELAAELALGVSASPSPSSSSPSSHHHHHHHIIIIIIIIIITTFHQLSVARFKLRLSQGLLRFRRKSLIVLDGARRVLQVVHALPGVVRRRPGGPVDAVLHQPPAATFHPNQAPVDDLLDIVGAVGVRAAISFLNKWW
ncbi:hypothetical protein TYRP_011644 [Tyrophagus putrescentiae]|nr:hypothetical protein TYRP_011644 [Tyrophagus putrescentiae]